MSFFERLGLVTSDEEPIKKEIKKTAIPSVSTLASAPNPQINFVGENNSIYIKILDNALEKVNLPGPDFREFYKTLKTLEGQSLPEQQKYIVAFSGFSAMGLTKQKTIDTSSIYIKAIEEEKINFQKTLDQYNKTEIEDKSTKVTKLSEENEKLQKQILDNINNINELNTEIAKNKQNLLIKQQSFNNVIDKEMLYIQTVITNIKTYL